MVRSLVQPIATNTLPFHEENNVCFSESPKTVQVQSKEGSTLNLPVEALLLLLVIDKTAYIESEGRNIALEVENTCKKMRMLDSLYKNVLELSEKDGSLDWKGKGLGPSIETARNMGFEIPARDAKLPREERDALLRSITQQRDDLSTQASHQNIKLNRCYTLRDDHFRYVTGLLSSMNDSFKKIFRNTG